MNPFQFSDYLLIKLHDRIITQHLDEGMPGQAICNRFHYFISIAFILFYRDYNQRSALAKSRDPLCLLCMIQSYLSEHLFTLRTRKIEVLEIETKIC